MRDERGDIIVGWLTKIVVVISLLGVLGFDLVSVATTKMSAADDAQNAARKAAVTLEETRGNIQAAYATALDYAEEHNGVIDPADFVVLPDRTVRVTVVKTANTVLFYRTGTSKKWAHVSAEASAKAP